MAVLSLLFIGGKSIWIDEAASIFFARDWTQMWQYLPNHEANMWLYYTMLNPWLKLGHGEAIVRALSAVFAVVTIPVIYLLGRQLFGPRAGAISSLLIASNAFFISYAQEARGYTLLVLLVTLSSLFFVRTVQTASWKILAGTRPVQRLGALYALICSTRVLRPGCVTASARSKESPMERLCLQ